MVHASLKIAVIPETSHVDYVLFEAAGLLKEGLIREWNQIPKDELKHLRSYLLQVSALFNFSSASLTLRRNTQECLSWSWSRLVRYLQGSPRLA
jgi:hypothetical protein